MKTLLCDIGNVLVRFSHERALRQVADVCGMDPDDAFRLMEEHRLIERLETGDITEQQFCELALSHGTHAPAHDTIIQAWCDMFDPIEPMQKILVALKEKGIRLVALSNISDANYRFLRDEYNLFEPFDDLVLSFEVGVMKPNATIFHKALEKAQCRPSECFYIDDIEEYIQVARCLGIDAEVHTHHQRLIELLAHRGIDLSESMS